MLTSGKFVEVAGNGSAALLFREGGELRKLSVPGSITEGDEWKSGKVRHVAAAVHQGLYGTDENKEMGARYIASMVQAQEAAGAWFLDLNVDEFSTDQKEKIRAMQWAAGVIQKVSNVPISVDSSDSEILKAGLTACDPSKGKPMVNSVSLERSTLIPIAAKAHANVIAGATGASSMPETVDDRLKNIAELMEKLRSAGISLDEIYLDPLVYPISVDVNNSGKVIDSIKAMRSVYGPSIHFAPGLSNVSYGYPERNVINQVFARLCLDAGCDGGIVDPAQINDKVLSAVDYSVETIRLAFELLEGRDEWGMNYIQAFRKGSN